MADKKSFMMMNDWVVLISELPEEKAGSLIKAMCAFQLTGEMPETDPVVNAMLSMIAPVMAENNAKYDAKVERLSQNASKSESKTNRDRNANKSESKSKQIDTEMQTNRNRKANKSGSVPVPVSVPDTLKESIYPPISPLGDSGLSDPVREKLEEWLRYKKERRESYKPTGLKSLVSQVRNKELEFGSQPVIDVIDLSMSNQWRGIIWEKVKPPDKPPQEDYYDRLLREATKCET